MPPTCWLRGNKMYRFILPQQVYLYSVSALCDKLLRKEAQRIQLQDIGEPKYHFLDAGCLQLGQLVADRIWTADQRACCHRAAQERGGDLRSGLFVGFSDGTHARYGTVNAFVIAPNGPAVMLAHGKLPL